MLGRGPQHSLSLTLQLAGGTGRNRVSLLRPGMLLKKQSHRGKKQKSFIDPSKGLMPGNKWSPYPPPMGDRQNSAGQSMAPPVRVELPNPGAPSLKLKLLVLSLRKQAQDCARPRTLRHRSSVRNCTESHQSWAGFVLWPPATVEGLSPRHRRPLPGSDTMKGGTGLQAWGAQGSRKGCRIRGWSVSS